MDSIKTHSVITFQQPIGSGNTTPLNIFAQWRERRTDRALDNN